MNNEPVAWIKQNPETLQAELHFDKPAKYWATVISNPDIPLYTHPVSQYKAITNTKIEPTVVSYTHPVKELGYNDIMGTWWETMPNAKSCEGVFEFARAILRKASEK